MSITLRIILILVSLLAVIYTLRKIRKAQLNIDDAIYWIVLSVLLLVLSVFPQTAEWGAQLLGFISPSNFVLVVMIFMVLIKLFQVAVDLSIAKYRLNLLIQKMALLNKETDIESRNENNSFTEDSHTVQNDTTTNTSISDTADSTIKL